MKKSKQCETCGAPFWAVAPVECEACRPKTTDATVRAELVRVTERMFRLERAIARIGHAATKATRWLTAPCCKCNSQTDGVRITVVPTGATGWSASCAACGFAVLGLTRRETQQRWNDTQRAFETFRIVEREQHKLRDSLAGKEPESEDDDDEEKEVVDEDTRDDDSIPVV